MRVVPVKSVRPTTKTSGAWCTCAGVRLLRTAGPQVPARRRNVSVFTSHGSASPTKLLLVESGKIYRISCADWPSLLSHVFRGVDPFDKFSAINLRPFSFPRHYFDRTATRDSFQRQLKPILASYPDPTPSLRLLLNRHLLSLAEKQHRLFQAQTERPHYLHFSSTAEFFNIATNRKVVQWKETHR